MNPVRLLRYIKGFVSFTGKGGFTERFINLCSKRKILLWDTSYIDGVLHAKCCTSDYFKLKEISKKSGVSIKIDERYGFKEDLNKQKSRAGLLMGCIFFITFFSLMSNFVWIIDVSGNEGLSKEEIIVMAENEGLHIGTFKPFFDEVSSANSISKKSNGVLSWTAINIKGSHAVIEVREQKESIKNTQKKVPCNILSDVDGVVISAEIFEGISHIHPGDAVKKGDLLISGVIDNEDMSTFFVEAKGKISAHTKREVGMSFTKNAFCRKLDEIRKKYSLSFFSIHIPLNLLYKKDAFHLTHKQTLSFNKTELPVSLNSQTYYTLKNEIRDINKVFLSSLEEFSFESKKYNRNALILSENFVMSENEEKIIFKNYWDTITFIGSSSKIYTEN